MKDWYDEYGEFDEGPEECLEKEILEEVFIDDMKIPDVDWAEDIERIKDPEIREREIETAERILDHERSLKERLKSGKITKDRFVTEKEFFRINPIPPIYPE